MATKPSNALATAGDSTTGTHPSVRRARAVSRLLDDAIRIPGTDVRVGLDPILGILPVGGDAVAAVVSLYIVLEAARAGAPVGLLVKMLLVIAVDFVAGSVPVIGVVFDAFWKANAWNVSMLESHLEESV